MNTSREVDGDYPVVGSVFIGKDMADSLREFNDYEDDEYEGGGIYDEDDIEDIESGLYIRSFPSRETSSCFDCALQCLCDEALFECWSTYIDFHIYNIPLERRTRMQTILTPLVRKS